MMIEYPNITAVPGRENTGRIGMAPHSSKKIPKKDWIFRIFSKKLREIAISTGISLD
jgi:hypothetical protein